MIKFMYFTIAIPIVFMLGGCSLASKDVAKLSQSKKTDVFSEVSTGKPVPAGSIELLIKASLKIPQKGRYLVERNAPLQAYPFLINIDGQSVLWEAAGAFETTPQYDLDGKTSRDPDAGAGIKYTLSKKIRISTGPHKIVLGLPEEPFYTEVLVTLTENSHLLKFEPRYRYKTIPLRIPTFLKGIADYETKLDSQIIRKG